MRRDQQVTRDDGGPHTQIPRAPHGMVCGSMRTNKNSGDRFPMRHLDHDTGDTEALPTDGMDVEEVSDPDMLRRFVLEWHRCDRCGGAETIVVRPPHRAGLLHA